MSVGGFGTDCDLPGCRECGNPVEPPETDAVADAMVRHARLGLTTYPLPTPEARYRVGEVGGAVRTETYTLGEAVQVAVRLPVPAIVYRETPSGDLLLTCRIGR